LSTINGDDDDIEMLNKRVQNSSTIKTVITVDENDEQHAYRQFNKSEQWKVSPLKDSF
jgi:hypothetical protein